MLSGKAKKEYQKNKIKRSNKDGSNIKGLTAIVQEANKMYKDEQDIMYFKVDGQRFYPGRNGYHPEGCKCNIEHKNRPPEGGLD